MRTILLRVYQIRSVRGKPTDAWEFEYIGYLGNWVNETWRRELSTPAAVPWRGVAPCFRLSQLRSYPPCLRHTDVLLHTVFVSVFLFLPIPVSGTQRCVIVLLTTLNLTKMCALTISVSGTTLYYWVSQLCFYPRCLLHMHEKLTYSCTEYTHSCISPLMWTPVHVSKVISQPSSPSAFA